MKIKELLTDKSKWTKLTSARDKNGIPCPPVVFDPKEEPACWCLEGAIQLCYFCRPERETIRRRIKKAINDEAIDTWNDLPERAFEDIQKLINELDI